MVRILQACAIRSEQIFDLVFAMTESMCSSNGLKAVRSAFEFPPMPSLQSSTYNSVCDGDEAGTILVRCSQRLCLETLSGSRMLRKVVENTLGGYLFVISKLHRHRCSSHPRLSHGMSHPVGEPKKTPRQEGLNARTTLLELWILANGVSLTIRSSPNIMSCPLPNAW